MATLTVQHIGRSGVAPTYAAAAGGGDSFLPGATTFLHVKNGGGGSISASIVTPAAFGDLTMGDPGATIGAGSERMFGPWPPQFFGDPTDGLADIVYSGVASVTVGVFELKQP